MNQKSSIFHREFDNKIYIEFIKLCVQYKIEAKVILTNVLKFINNFDLEDIEDKTIHLMLIKVSIEYI